MLVKLASSSCVCVRVCMCVCEVHLQSDSHAFFMSVVDHLLPQAIHSLKNQSLDTLGLQLSLKSPSTVELFRALPQSRLKEFQFTSFDKQVVRLCCSLLLNTLLQVTWQKLQVEGKVAATKCLLV